MFRPLVLLAILALACAAKADSANDNSFPSLASLRKFDFHACPGTILKNNIILTAASCLLYTRPSMLTIQYGRKEIGGNENVIESKNYRMNSEYNPRTKNGNVAMVILKSNITVSDTARPIELAAEVPATGTEGVLYGWGRPSEGEYSFKSLQSTNVKIVDRSACEARYANQVLANDILCAEVTGNESDGCLLAETGAPLVIDNKQFGMVSTGFGCTRPGELITCTNILTYNTWIQEAVKLIEAEN